VSDCCVNTCIYTNRVSDTHSIGIDTCVYTAVTHSIGIDTCVYTTITHSIGIDTCVYTTITHSIGIDICVCPIEWVTAV
jgi:hypothetical protein